jgi:hypothetical protein
MQRTKATRLLAFGAGGVCGPGATEKRRWVLIAGKQAAHRVDTGERSAVATSGAIVWSA